MKLRLLPLLLILLLSSLSMGAQAVQKVAYGEDNRVSMYETKNKKYLKLAKSTAAMIPANLIVSKEQQRRILGLFPHQTTVNSIESETLVSAMKVCKNEKFTNLPTAAMCSGFLIGPDLIATAGHCISDWKNQRWVFDYNEKAVNKKSVEGEFKFTVKTSNIYKAVKVVTNALDNATMADYAVLKLDRKVRGRRVLKVRKKGVVAEDMELVVIGHPSGLPTMIADSAQVRSVNDVYFIANLDTFGGNSGSAVFNAKTKKVEGILVRGERDYVYDFKDSCYRVNKVAEDEGRGEDVTRMDIIPNLQKHIKDSYKRNRWWWFKKSDKAEPAEGGK